MAVMDRILTRFYLHFVAGVALACTNNAYADSAPTAIRDTASNLCLGVSEDRGSPFWHTMLVTCTDPKYTKWIILDDGNIESVDLKTCLGAWERPVNTHGSGNPHNPTWWLVVLVPCHHSEPYTNWALEIGKIRNKERNQCISVYRDLYDLNYPFHSPAALVDCAQGRIWATP
jgi:hypothetical protein